MWLQTHAWPVVERVQSRRLRSFRREVRSCKRNHFLLCLPKLPSECYLFTKQNEQVSEHADKVQEQGDGMPVWGAKSIERLKKNGKKHRKLTV